MCIAVLVWPRVHCFTGVALSARTSLTMANSLDTNEV